MFFTAVVFQLSVDNKNKLSPRSHYSKHLSFHKSGMFYYGKRINDAEKICSRELKMEFKAFLQASTTIPMKTLRDQTFFLS